MAGLLKIAPRTHLELDTTASNDYVKYSKTHLMHAQVHVYLNVILQITWELIRIWFVKVEYFSIN